LKQKIYTTKAISAGELTTKQDNLQSPEGWKENQKTPQGARLLQVKEHKAG
jgi:hypothetical protein